MKDPAAYKYSYTLVVVFGILGNILVIISILRQKKLLKNNYYFLVLHLATCDLVWLVVNICTYIQHILFQEKENSDKTFCLFYQMRIVFRVAGIYIMMVISVLRYRATLHPLKSDIRQQRLRVVCGLGYILGFVVYGGSVPLCFIQLNSFTHTTYTKYFNKCVVFFFHYAPTVVMAVLYYKIYRALINQNKYLKSLGSNPVAENNFGSSFTIVNYLKNRKTFLVSVGTVLCYGVGNFPLSLVFILEIANKNNLLTKHVWIQYLAFVLRVAGSHSVNPLVYGILDKKLLTFWRFCSKRVRRQTN